MQKNKKCLKAIVCVVSLLLMLFFLAPYIVPFDPYIQDLSVSLTPPSTAHWLGTDTYGRDVFSRILVGGRTTVFIALLIVICIALIGTCIGILSGYIGGRFDSIVMRLTDVFLAFPGIVLAIAIAGIFGGGILNAALALTIISWPKYARLSRSHVLLIRDMPYIAASKLSGSGTFQILIRHVLPGTLSLICVTAALDVGTIIMELSGLSFLGLGAAPPAAEWGTMMSRGRSMLQTAPWVILSPGMAILITVMAFNLLGDQVRDVLDPKLSQSE